MRPLGGPPGPLYDRPPSAMATPSAQFSLTLRVELPHESGTLGKVTAAITRAGGAIVAVDTVETGGAEHAARDHDRLREPGPPRARDQGGAGRARRQAGRDHRPHLRAAPRRQDLHRAGRPGEDPRRPLDGLHARRGAGLHRDRREPPEGLQVHDQGEHGGRGHRRHRRAGAGRHRARGGHARDGGQGDALQGVRRTWTPSRSPRHQGSRPDRRDREAAWRPRSAASTSRTSPRRAASRSSSG